ncbi:hypothetical protein HDU97_007616 [Phlyctochytrium planicorne]|nr:hypothetical protein HDU97_007616 [Phlyctochytrium planicorne]
MRKHQITNNKISSPFHPCDTAEEGEPHTAAAVAAVGDRLALVGTRLAEGELDRDKPVEQGTAVEDAEHKQVVEDVEDKRAVAVVRRRAVEEVDVDRMAVVEAVEGSLVASKRAAVVEQIVDVEKEEVAGTVDEAGEQRRKVAGLDTSQAQEGAGAGERTPEADRVEGEERHRAAWAAEEEPSFEE